MGNLYTIDNIDDYSQLMIGQEVRDAKGNYILITQIIKIDCLHGHMYFYGIEVEKINEY